MPPISSRLTAEATNLISRLDRRYVSIRDERIPALRGCTGPSLEAQQRLADEVRDEVSAFSKEIESLLMMVDDQSVGRARTEVKGLVDKYTDDLHELRAQTRSAILTSKKAIDTNLRASNRNQLFATSSQSQPMKESKAPKTLDEASTTLTTALQRTVLALQAELETSVFSTQLLKTSTDTLRAASNQHTTLTTAMDTSKHLLTALEKADWLDRLLLLGGLGFFILVVLFILKQRFIDRGVRMMMWWWRFIPDFGGDDDLLRKAEERMLSVSSVMSASAVTAISTVAAALSSSSASVPPSSDVSTASEAATLTSDAGEPISTTLSSILPADSGAPESPLSLPTTATRRTHHTLPMEHVEL